MYVSKFGSKIRQLNIIIAFHIHDAIKERSFHLRFSCLYTPFQGSSQCWKQKGTPIELHLWAFLQANDVSSPIEKINYYYVGQCS